MPQEETEWMVTTAFNQAADWYGVGEDEKCKRWATTAIRLAHCLVDDGRLERLLREKFESLKAELPSSETLS